jgi:hypothetical protein
VLRQLGCALVCARQAQGSRAARRSEGPAAAGRSSGTLARDCGAGSACAVSAMAGAAAVAAAPASAGSGASVGAASAGAASAAGVARWELRRQSTSLAHIALTPRGAREGRARRWSASATLRREAWLMAVAAMLAIAIAPGAVLAEWVVREVTLALTQHAWSSCQGLVFDEDTLCIVVSSCVAAYTAKLAIMHSAVLATDLQRMRRLAKHVIVISAATGALSIALSATALARPRGLDTSAAVYAQLAVFALFFAPYLTFATNGVLLHGTSAREAAIALAAGLVIALVCVALGCASGFYLVLSENTSGFIAFLVNGEQGRRKEAGWRVAVG